MSQTQGCAVPGQPCGHPTEGRRGGGLGLGKVTRLCPGRLPRRGTGWHPAPPHLHSASRVPQGSSSPDPRRGRGLLPQGAQPRPPKAPYAFGFSHPQLNLGLVA